MCKIKSIAQDWQRNDPLWQTRVISIWFACNQKMTINQRFKGTLANYGYDTHGKAAFKRRLIRKDDVDKDSKVSVTINIRRACGCNRSEFTTGEYNRLCEVHTGKKGKNNNKTKGLPKEQKLLTNLWKRC